MTDRESIVKVHIDLTGSSETGGESMWAEPLGDDLYELRNTPFYAYSLNCLDVVHAVAASPHLKPSIVGVARRSGHRTLWVTFADGVSIDDCIAFATRVNEWYAYFEHAKGRYFAIDVEPRGNYDAVREQLGQWIRTGVVRRYQTRPSDFDVKDA
jgi:uncharacterized protein DUF4265